MTSEARQPLNTTDGNCSREGPVSCTSIPLSPGSTCSLPPERTSQVSEQVGTQSTCRETTSFTTTSETTLAATPSGPRPRDIENEPPVDFAAGSCREKGDEETEKCGLLRAWGLEMAACLASMGILVVIVVVLKIFDNRVVQTLPLNITLNAFLAFFAMITKALLMYPIIECISQWKWNWFDSPHPMADFEIFDSSSRGVFGSINLLWRLKGRHVVCIGAAVVIIAVVIEPLTQQMILIPTRLAPIPGVASVAALTDLDMSVLQEPDDGGYSTVARDMEAVVNAAFTGGSRNPVQPVSPTCSSADCTFPEFATLGICHKVVDVSDKLTLVHLPNPDRSGMTIVNLYKNLTGPGINATMSRDCFVSGQFDGMMGMCFARAENSFAFSSDEDLVETGLYSQTLIWNNSEDEWHAVDAILYWCVQTHSVSVSNGTTTTRVVRESHTRNDELSNGTSNWVIPWSPTRIERPDNGAALYFDNGDEPQPLVLEDEKYGRFSLDYRYFNTLATFLFGHSQVVWYFAGALGEGWTSGSASVEYSGTVYVYGAHEFDRQFAGVERIVGSLATSLTNFFRTYVPDSSEGSGLDPNKNGFVYAGTVYAVMSYVHIEWGWLGLLLSLFVISVAFLAVTMLKTRSLSRGRWPLKSSALATLRALGPAERKVVGGLRRPHILEKGDKHVWVMFDQRNIVLSQEKMGRIGDEGSNEGVSAQATGNQAGLNTPRLERKLKRWDQEGRKRARGQNTKQGMMNWFKVTGENEEAPSLGRNAEGEVDSRRTR